MQWSATSANNLTPARQSFTSNIAAINKNNTKRTNSYNRIDSMIDEPL